MKNGIAKIVPLLWLSLWPWGGLHSQDEGTPLAVGNYHKVSSGILNEERTIVVSLPYLYDKLGKRYPVLYVLDGEDFALPSFIGMARFLSPQRIPEMIIVGVLNTNRNRDLFVTRVEGLPDTREGGASLFLGFLSKELIPYIDARYRTTSHRTIYGQSAGGQFVLFALLTDPGAFDAYLASSPVIGYSDRVLLDKAEEFFRPGKALNKSLCVYYGTTDYHSVTGKIPLLEAIIRRNPPQGFSWNFRAVEGRHVPWESFRELLTMLYPSWDPVSRPAIVPARGELLQGQTLYARIEGGADPVHYTLDGGEPTARSPVAAGPVAIDRDTTLKARSIRPGLQETRTVEAQFQVVGRLHPAVKISAPRPGLKYRYVERQVFQLPDRVEDADAKSGVVAAIDLGVRGRDHLYLIEYDGYLKVPKGGRYRLTLRTTSARLFLDGEEVITAGGLLAEETARDLCLARGYHPFRIVTRMFLQPAHVLELSWEGPGIGKQAIPARAFFHD